MVVTTECALMTTLQVMASSGERDHHTSPSNPHTYAKIVGKISFFLGFWALFVFFKVTALPPGSCSGL